VLTLVLYGLLAIAIMAGLFFLAASFLPAGEQIAPPVRDEAPWDLPSSRRLDAADVAAVRLPVALRGYRFAETDVLLDRLGEELRQRDAEIARLRRSPQPYPLSIAATDPADYRPPRELADDDPDALRSAEPESESDPASDQPEPPDAIEATEVASQPEVAPRPEVAQQSEGAPPSEGAEEPGRPDGS
jgi:hypothetical protein